MEAGSMTSCEMPGRDTQSNVNALMQHIMASFLNRNWRTLFGQGDGWRSLYLGTGSGAGVW